MTASTAIVTGASSGVGRALSLRLLGRGWRVVLVGRRSAPLESLAAEAGSGTPIVLPADVADPAAAAGIVAAATAGGSSIDGLVNNAGLAELAAIDATDDAMLRRAMAVNAEGPARLIGAAWPHLRRPGAAVVNVSSAATADPFPGFMAYAAAKSAVESLARSVMNEGGEDGLRAWNVAPGAIETPMLRGLFGEDVVPAEATLAPDAVAEVIEACLLGERPEPAGSTIRISAGS